MNFISYIKYLDQQRKVIWMLMLML